MTSAPSPCIGVCKLKDDICLGCGRTLQEITEAGLTQPKKDHPQMTPLQKAEDAIAHRTTFNGDTHDKLPLYTVKHDCLYELPHDEGHFTFGDFRALVNDYAELRHRLEK